MTHPAPLLQTHPHFYPLSQLTLVLTYNPGCPQKDTPFPSRGETDSSSKPLCRGCTRYGYGQASGKEEKGICACMNLVTYFPCFFWRWNEAFQKEVLSSRLETTDLLARAIAKAAQPPQAWILVTGVGMPQITNPLHEPGEESPQ